MFEGLDDVAWSELSHAYGEATDVPEQIRALVSADEDEREAALDACYGNIYHQCSRYPATVAAVPFIIEALESEHAARARVLKLLGHLAVGWPWKLTFCGFDAIEELLPARFESSFRRRTFTSDEAVTHRAVYLAAAEGCPVYRRCLGDEDDAVRVRAAWLLAWFPAHAAGAASDLRAVAVDRSQSELLRASAWLTLSHLGQDTSDLRTSLSTPVSSGPVPHLNAVAILAEARRQAANGSAPDDIIDAVNDIAERGVIDPGDDEGEDDDPVWSGDSMDDLVWAAVSAVNGDIEHLLSRLPAASTKGRGVEVAQRLLEAAFGSLDRAVMWTVRPKRLIDGMGWSDEQRQVLDAITRADTIWPEVSYPIHVALGLDFDPTREDLVAALIHREDPPSERASDDAQAQRLTAKRIDELTRQLDAPDGDVRAEAARTLGGSADQLPLETLERLADLAIDDGDSDVRTGASWALGKAGANAEPLLGRLLDALGKGISGCDSVPYALCEMGRGVMGPVLEALRSDDEDLAFAAQRAFPSVERAGVDAVIEALRDHHPRVRQVAAYAFQSAFEHRGVLGQSRAIPPLIDTLDDPVEDVRQRAVWALREVKGKDVHIIAEAVNTASGQRLLGLLEVVQSTAEHVGMSVLPALASALSAPAAAICIEAVTAIGNLEASPATAAALRPALSDQDVSVRRVATTVAGSLGRAARQLAPSVAELLDDRDAMTRQAAATALGRIGVELSDTVIRRLGELVMDDDALVRMEAAWALGCLGHAAALTRSAPAFAAWFACWTGPTDSAASR